MNAIVLPRSCVFGMKFVSVQLTTYPTGVISHSFMWLEPTPTKYKVPNRVTVLAEYRTVHWKVGASRLLPLPR